MTGGSAECVRPAPHQGLTWCNDWSPGSFPGWCAGRFERRFLQASPITIAGICSKTSMSRTLMPHLSGRMEQVANSRALL